MRVLVVFLVMASLGAVAHAEDSARQADQERADVNRANICFGGLDDGKLIPHDDDVERPFRETTLLGCSVEGGRPVFLPDLAPKVVDGVLV